MDKNVKAMMKISDVLDDRYQKLSDKYHDLMLSHNRKKKALEKVYKSLKAFNDYVEFPVGTIFGDMLKICDSALFCDGRERSKK